MPCRIAPVVAALLFAGLPVTSSQAQNSKFNTFFSDIGGGTLNAIGTGAYTWIGGGLYNQVYSNNSGTISGGYSNVIVVGNFGTIGGGAFNVVRPSFATIAGGSGNTIGTNAQNATIAGGKGNSAGGDSSAILGGVTNSAAGTYATAVGGAINSALADRGTVAGGEGNTVFSQGIYGSIGGGQENLVRGGWGTVGGGYQNEVTGSGGAVPGGSLNVATNWAFAAGDSARATNQGSFVWSSGGTTISTNNNSFTARAPGGVRFITSTNLTGAILAAGATSWAVLSDREAKTDIEPIEPRAILKKVAELPVTSWHYKHDLKRRYIGPMAQDFHAAFGLGSDDKTITTLDTDGVTLAAIKGLVEELEEVRAENAALKVQNEQFKARFEAIDERLSQLPPAP